MEQSDLRNWESKCIQEETPQCVATCPLHVDARTFCSLLGQRRVDKAWQVLAKTMPLPGVLARLCDAPCKAACVRKDVGGAIEMGALERYCAENAKPVEPPKPLPARGKSVVVLGGSLTGVCAAWELGRRGFDVSLHCHFLGAGLDDLPHGVLEREIESLRKMGVDLKESISITPELLACLLEEKDAVFIDSDDVPDSLLDFGEPDELTLGTRRAGVFASRKRESSSILQAAAGRRAANSIERFTQGVSMVSGRDLEGPYATRLYTNITKVEPAEPMQGEPTEAIVRDEAKRCLQCECMECVKGCEYLRHYKYYPKVYARQIYNNESIVMGTRQANKMINSCMLCGLCETVCPEDFSVGDMCLEARNTMVEQGKMPQSAHEFALRDMGFANSDKCVLGRHAPGVTTSEYLFFPGCQLTASDPDGVTAAYADLRGRLGNVGLLLHCCGAPAEWSARKAAADEVTSSIKAEWERLGSPRIIVACPTCLKSLRKGLPEAEIVSQWTLLGALGLPKGTATDAGRLAVNDPCATRHDAMAQADVRKLLGDLQVDVAEPDYTCETTQCCGFGGLLSEANPDLGYKVAELRAESMEEDWVTYCVMCRDMIARTGKRAMHLYDLLYPRLDDPAARPAPGYSARRENRVRLKEELHRSVWNEEHDVKYELFESIEVAFTDEAATAMEKRRILKSDIQKVLLQARESCSWLVNDESGHLLASFRSVVVTYWVEFEEQGDGYLVHNTWCHRMRIKGGQP